MLTRYRAALRSLGLDTMFSTSMWFIIATLVGTFSLWIAAYGLRTYLYYDALAEPYFKANATLYMAKNRESGSDYRALHPEDILKSRELLKIGRLKRSILETWQNSYLCGGTACFDMLTGGLDMKMLSLYLLAIGFGMSLIGQAVVNVLFAVTRVNTLVGKGPIDEDDINTKTPHAKSA